MKIRKEIMNYFEKPEVTKKYGVAVDAVGLWKSEENIIKKYFDKSSKILDLGCGSGRTTFGLINLGFTNLTAVDLSESMIEQAKNIALEKNLIVDFQQGDATDLIFDSESFDNCLFSFNGFNAIPTEELRKKALKEIYRILKPGGKYIFTSHNRDQIDFKKHWEEEKERWKNAKQNPMFEMFGDHFIQDENNNINFIHFYSIDELKILLKNTGFDILNVIDRNQNFMENREVQKFSNNTIFYIVQKPIN